jgi:hypothetical protein
MDLLLIIPDALPTAKPHDPGSKNREALSGSRKPPIEGPCKGCGLDKPLNRMMLCYKCWKAKNIMDIERAKGNDWIPGDPHPDWCLCDDIGGCATKHQGN